MLVKTAHKNFPVRNLMGGTCRKWCATHSIIDDTNLLAVNFLDLKLKNFSTSSTTLNGPSCKTNTLA